MNILLRRMIQEAEEEEGTNCLDLGTGDYVYG